MKSFVCWGVFLGGWGRGFLRTVVVVMRNNDALGVNLELKRPCTYVLIRT